MSLSVFAFSHIPENGNKTQTLETHFFQMICIGYQMYYLNLKKQTHNISFCRKKKDSSKIITIVDIFSMYYIQFMEHNHIKGS